jgi:hypothetical protein
MGQDMQAWSEENPDMTAMGAMPDRTLEGPARCILHVM